MGPISGLASVWIHLRIASKKIGGSEILLVLDLIVFCTSMARTLFGDFIPISGHMFFLCHTMLTVKKSWYKVVSLLLVLHTTYFKLVIWNDVTTWLNGFAAGVLSGVVYLIAENYNHRRFDVSK